MIWTGAHVEQEARPAAEGRVALQRHRRLGQGFGGRLPDGCLSPAVPFTIRSESPYKLKPSARFALLAFGAWLGGRKVHQLRGAVAAGPTGAGGAHAGRTVGRGPHS